MAINGIVFVPVLLLGPWLPIGPEALGLPWGGPEARAAAAYAMNLTPVLLTCALLAVSGMLAMPYVQSVVPMFGGGRLAGTYIGMSYLMQGVGAAISQMVTGTAFNVGAASGMGQVPWLVMTLLEVGSAAGGAVLAPKRLLTGPVPSKQSVPG